MASIRKRTWTTKGEEQTAWVVDYKDQSGKRALKTFATKKEAEAWSVSALHEVSLGTHTRASASKTVTEAWELWIEQCEADKLEFGTIKQRRAHLKHHVKDFIGSLRLSDLSTPLAYDFDTKLRQAGRSIAMRRKVVTNLKTMLTFAQGRGLVAQNVARGVRVKSDDRESNTGPLRAGVDFPSMAELNSLIDSSDGRWRPFFITAIFTGMRLSELRGLRWSDIDLDAGVIHVRQRADAWAIWVRQSPKPGSGTFPSPRWSSMHLSNGRPIAPRAISYSLPEPDRCIAPPTSTAAPGCRCSSSAASPMTVCPAITSTCCAMQPPACSSPI